MSMTSLFSPMPGDLIRPTTTVNLRRTPGYLGKTDGDLIAQATPADRLRVLSTTPARADGLSWWEVERDAGATQPAAQGWIAQTVPGAETPLFEPVEHTVHLPLVQAPAGQTPTRSVLGVGNWAITQALVNLRRAPGIRNKPADDVIVAAPSGSRVLITDGPRTLDEMTWWQVEATVNSQSVTGWMAQATADGIRLLAPTNEDSETPPSDFRIGDEVHTQTTVRLRRSPGYVGKPADDILTDVSPNTAVRLLDGPRTEDSLTWWQGRVTVGGVDRTGWMAQVGPDGVVLLATASVDLPETPAPIFQIGARLVTATSLRVRRQPGHIGQPEGDVLGGFWPDMTLWVRGGPQQADGLTWWLVSGVVTGGETVTGWTAQQLDNGTDLLAAAPPLPGTEIPTPAQGLFLGAPFVGRRPISQLFGENPEFYGRFSYNGIPLRGHNAVDFAMPVGVPLLAIDNGEVSQIGFDRNGYGHFIVVKHAWGEAIYAHMNNVDINLGQSVSRGFVLGQSGNTGASTGPHLHFAIRRNNFNREDGWGGWRDPLPYLDPVLYTLPSYLLRSTARVTTPAGPFKVMWALPPSGMSAENEEQPRP
ncbi:peptidoglycan DD-metalloendopeptidase family protein [bacterium]|nr:peptidoglycan DD-metalloendopeptidase family protein [bacterium]